MPEMMKLWEQHEKTIIKAAEVGTFVYLVTAKDIAAAIKSGNWQKYDTQTKVELIIASLLGRTLGIQPFPSKFTYTSVFVLSQALNPWSSFFGFIWVLGQAGVFSSKITTIAGKLTVAAALGGVFDAPTSAQDYVRDSPPNSSPGDPAGVIQGLNLPAFAQQQADYVRSLR